MVYLGKVALLIWCIWDYRNRNLNIQITKNTDRTHFYNHISRIFQENQRISETHLENSRQRRSENYQNHEIWVPPRPCRWKFNSDASWNDDLKIGGFGWVVRDSGGSLICAGLQSSKGEWLVSVLEAKAMWEGLSCLFARFGDNLDLEVESDCLGLVRCLNKDCEDLSEIKNLVDVILDLAPKLGVLSFKHCPRIQNGVAHSIAQMGAFCNSISDFDAEDQTSLLEGQHLFWSSDPPPWLSSLIEKEVVVTEPFISL